MSRLSVLVASIAFVVLDDTYALVAEKRPASPLGAQRDEGPGSDQIRAAFER
jgi:hypothetical protein